MFNKSNNISNSIIKKIHNKEITTQLFHEIMCPLKQIKLKTSLCINCKFCQINKLSHQTNRTLTSFICMYGQNEGSD